MFQAGIVGCGGIAQVHAAVLSQLPDVHLAACADIRQERAEALAAKYGCQAFASMEEMLDACQLDVVHLCTPHNLHTPMAELAAGRGIAVLTEKPPVIDRDQWRRLRQAAERVPIGVCFQNRYNRNVQEARRLIGEGTYGRVVAARAFVTWSRSAAYYQNSLWRGRLATEGGGALINQAIHTLDLLVWLMGAPETVEASLRNHHLQGVIEVEDTAEIYLRIQGRPALLYATTAYAQDAPVFVELALEGATLRLADGALDIVAREETTHRAFRAEEPLGKGYWGNGHMPCIRDFYACLKSGQPFGNSLAGVAATVETMLQIYEKGR